MKKTAIWLLLMMTLCLQLAFATGDGQQTANGQIDYVNATVTKVNETTFQSDGFVDEIYIVEVQLNSGERAGEVLSIEHSIISSDPFPLYLKAGDKVVVGLSEDINGDPDIFIYTFRRDIGLYILIAVFVLAILWVGRWQGLKTIITLFITLALIRFVHIPLLLKGVNPLVLTVVIATIATVLTILIITGRTKKSYAAIFGTVAGVILAGVLAALVSHLLHITGLSNQDAIMLKYIPQGDIFNPAQLLLSGIILGSLGAVMDVAMSIASSIEEINAVSPGLSGKQLYRSGLNIGRDVMGTMTNTLILAYVGSALPLILLFSAYQTPYIQLINMDLIATEIIRSLSGSIGIVMSIPITAMAAVFLIKKTSDRRN